LRANGKSPLVGTLTRSVHGRYGRREYTRARADAINKLLIVLDHDTREGTHVATLWPDEPQIRTRADIIRSATLRAEAAQSGKSVVGLGKREVLVIGLGADLLRG
jgi:hypothetical protein